MNAFWLDEDLDVAVQYHATMHAHKLILEAAQVLQTALYHYGLGDEVPYKKSHSNHPLTRWATESQDNWFLLREYAYALERQRMKEGALHPHASAEVLTEIPEQLVTRVLPDLGPTPRPYCLPDEYRIEGDLVASYRNYYVNDKMEHEKFEWRADEPEWVGEYL